MCRALLTDMLCPYLRRWLCCSDRDWRLDLRSQVRDITERRGLNASQQQAIALAMVSTLTLWQVRRAQCVGHETLQSCWRYRVPGVILLP